ncbi:Arginine metabolism regulation II [Lecanosticta acicola]|uniref:Arginine metabolism regulation II n=1 Tax=Lecanosticta acicola TaxID=111012 RepID=A0AAI8YXC8_9PEZI|nr:Arginine metabolism regulation II [Lecanosticta acicola]
MVGSGTRRSVKKSRGGCTRCKAQHLKCDEKKPGCGRCERLGITCPGYSQSLRWSTKHEVNSWRVDRLAAAAAASASASASSPTSPEQTDLQIPAQNGGLEWLDFSYGPSMENEVGLASPIGDNHLFGIDNLHDWTPNDLLLVPEENTSLTPLMPHQPSSALDQPMLKSLGPRRSRPQTSGGAIPKALAHQPSDLLSYYFQVMPRVYSTFDSHKNPFRTAVSDLFSHSLAVNLAAQSMAAAFLSEVHPRFAAIGAKLRREALQVIQSKPSNDYDVLLALMMCGPTGNWHQTSDLGLAAYKEMRSRLHALSASEHQPPNLPFFQEGMLHWEMILSYAADSNLLGPGFKYRPAIPRHAKHEAHPWTGVGHQTAQIVADIGRLVRRQRLSSREQQFVTQAYIRQMSQDLDTARELEQRLLACEHPDESDIVPTEDAATPAWHIRAIAELNRYAGLLQLYRVFPDLLTERPQAEDATDPTASEENNATLVDLTNLSSPLHTDSRRNQWLTRFSLEALRILETIPAESGTKDFQPFIIVALASELVCETVPPQQQDTTAAVSSAFAEVAMMRKFVIDRLTAFLRLIPPKPIRACLDIIRDTWRRIDAGECDVYWLDVMIQNGWTTIMA